MLWAAGFVSLHGETGHKADRAVQYFDAAILANGTNPALAVEAADAYVYAGKPDEAIELVRDGMEETAHPDWYAWVLAWAYYFKARRAATNEEKKALYRIGIEHLEDAQPGRGGSPLDILLTRAALNAQLKALLENSTDPEEMAEKRAAGKEYNRATRRYNEWRSSDPARSSLTEDIVTATNPFSDDGDLEHWIEGLAKAEIIY